MRSWELPVSEKAQHLVAEDELGRMGIDVGDGLPRAVTQEDTACDDGMDVGVPLERGSEALDDSDHAGPSVWLLDGGGHHLADGFVGESSELPEKLSVVEEVEPEHLGDGKHPLRMRDISENLVLKQVGENRGTLRPTGWT